MHSSIKLTIAMVLLVGPSTAAFQFTDEIIMTAVRNYCPPNQNVCPKPEFSKDPAKFEWNETAIMDSDFVKALRSGEFDINNVGMAIAMFRNTYCCAHGPCLKNCKIAPRPEIDLVNGFPGNAPAIFGLNIAELEPFRKEVEKYIRINGWSSDGDKSAEIEEYFDFLAKNRYLINALLALEQL